MMSNMAETRHGQKQQENTPTSSSLQRVSAPPLAQTSLGDRKGNGPPWLKWEPLKSPGVPFAFFKMGWEILFCTVLFIHLFIHFSLSQQLTCCNRICLESSCRWGAWCDLKKKKMSCPFRELKFTSRLLPLNGCVTSWQFALSVKSKVDWGGGNYASASFCAKWDNSSAYHIWLVSG